VIQLYTWDTPNGKKVSIMLEEIGVPYKVHPVNLKQNDQMTPEYLAINPNNKIPAIIDTDGPGGKPFTLFESGAILMYLAEKSGKLLPQDMRKRYEVIQWLMFQMGGVGPIFGQANFFFACRRKFPTPSSVSVKKRYGFTTFSTKSWASESILRANIRSPTSPPILGFGAMRFIKSNWKSFPT